MKVAPSETRLRSLPKILALEARTGFQDKAVSGGLDRFLQRLQADHLSHPGLHDLLNHGMLNVAYRDLDSARRQVWVREALRLIGDDGDNGKGPAKPAPAMRLDAPVTTLPGVARAIEAKLAKLGVASVHDLLYLFPRRHLDYSLRRTVSHLQPGQEQTAVVSLWEAREVQLGRDRRRMATEAVVGDETGNIRAVWFGNKYLARILPLRLLQVQERTGAEVKLVLSGKVTIFQGRRQFESPEWELLEDQEMANLVHTGRLVPVYPTTKGLEQKDLRLIVRKALKGVLGPSAHPKPSAMEDPIKLAVRRRLGQMPLAEAVAQLHYPDTAELCEQARRGLAFDELLVLQLALARKRQQAAPTDGTIPLPPVPQVRESFVKSLPFELTPGQQSAIREALADMATAQRPMSRLLQGDVGSGKTVVALALLLTAVANGYQGVLMAPTEVLAEQHYLNVATLLRGLGQPVQEGFQFSFSVGGHPRPISVGLLTGSTPSAAKRELYQRAGSGTLDILIGTHAVIQQEVEIPNLALGVVDEQHRFGVMQRAALRGKGRQPHLLAMSATPIPRTLALTVYGDLDISVIPELPTGRQPVVTRFLSSEQQARAEAFVVSQAGQGRQAFVACPLIEESEALAARAATEEFERLRSGPMAGLRLGLLHGRLPLKEKQVVMDAFRRGEVDVLVCTQVIEVGIDVPNATVMLILGADRFGLAQLHQLRGRVGRGSYKSYCLLLAESPSPDAQRRLDTLVRTNDGFEIAEADMRLRGAGDFFGTRQSGLPTLRVARLSDSDLLVEARDEARRLLERSPDLQDQTPLGAAVQRYLQQTLVVDEVG